MMAPIDCWITVRDLLTTTRAMVERILAAELVGRVTIVDCESTYPPLLDWYAAGLPAEVRLIREGNDGPRAAWQHIGYPPDRLYVVTDCDLDLSAVPGDFLQLLAEGLAEHPSAIKAGLSLSLDGIPADHPHAGLIQSREEGFWSTLADASFFWADIDTTLAVYRGGHGWRGYGPSLRSKPPYVARHVPWHLDFDSLSEEWRWYFARSTHPAAMWSRMAQQALSSRTDHDQS
jgi:hypothetical protein